MPKLSACYVSGVVKMPAPIDNFNQFIILLEEQGELSRIAAEVDPLQEIAAITNLVCKSAGSGTALLFQQTRAACFPVATNLFGSRRRVCLALGVDRLDQLTERLALLLEQVKKPQFTEL